MIDKFRTEHTNDRFETDRFRTDHGHTVIPQKKSNDI